MKLRPAACLLLWLPTLLSAAEPDVWRTLSDGQGPAIQARFEGTRDGDFLLRRRSDAKLFSVAPATLKPADAAFYAEAAKRLAHELELLNSNSGHAFFSGTPFEMRDAAEIATALGLRKESETKFSRSWRLYAPDSYKLFGARPYSVALYADADGHPTTLSIVYANKGDFGSKSGAAEEHFKGGNDATASTLDAAMKLDENRIAKALGDALGGAQTQRFGEGKGRRTIQRWDWNGQSLLLSAEDHEYVSLQIVPAEFADAGGRTAQLKGDLLRARLRESVVREPNGDVFISQIPMVDQGPKGYCVPATFERAMRTMGIESDMYLLAMIGETGAGGGTSVEKLLENVRSIVYRKGRRTKDESARELRLRDVKRYIDEGVPVMWTMKSVEAYNQAANGNTAKRANVTDWDAYAKEIGAAAADTAKQPKPSENHHICMIMGYNEKTGELAVSDSWGPRFERRWVPLKVADWASQGGLFMILP